MEKIANNFIHIARKKQSPHAMWTVEIRSFLNRAAKPFSTIYFYMPCSKSPQRFSVSIPHCRKEKDVLIFFLIVKQKKIDTLC